MWKISIYTQNIGFIAKMVMDEFTYLYFVIFNKFLIPTTTRHQFSKLRIDIWPSNIFLVSGIFRWFPNSSHTRRFRFQLHEAPALAAFSETKKEDKIDDRGTVMVNAVHGGEGEMISLSIGNPSVHAVICQ